MVFFGGSVLLEGSTEEMSLNFLIKFQTTML